MFKRWLIGLIVSIGLLTGLSVELYQTYTEAQDAYIASFDRDLIRPMNQALNNFQTSVLATLGAFGLLLISLLARSIKQGRLVVLKSLPKVIFSKQHFEGMTFFKWGVLIIGIIIALAFLQIAGN
jgi:hypothetical protein